MADDEEAGRKRVDAESNGRWETSRLQRARDFQRWMLVAKRGGLESSKDVIRPLCLATTIASQGP